MLLWKSRSISPCLKRDHKEYILQCCHQTSCLITALTFGQPHEHFLTAEKRIILDTKQRSFSLPLFNTLNLLPFYQDAYINRCTLILNRTQNTWIPGKSTLQLNSDVYSINTRFSKLNLCCPIYNNYWRWWIFSVRSIDDWNNMEKALINSDDTKSFGV